MSKTRSSRLYVTVECFECRNHNEAKRSNGVNRYILSKNKKNTSEKLELLKHCKYCNKHTLHKEIK